jgi:putative DNA primase/helicase
MAMSKSALLKIALSDNAATVAGFLLGQHNAAMSSKTELRFGRKGSVSLVISGQKKGSYFDHEEGRGGDLLDLIQRELNVAFKEACAIAERLVGGAAGTQFVPRHTTPKPAVEGHEPSTNKREALKLWSGCVELRGTPAEHYLASRGITALPQGIEEVLRFHPAGPFGSARSPMLVALYRDIRTNETCAVHRTALSARGEKIGRMCLGPKTGAAIKLSADEEVAQGLVIGEGIETTLSAMMFGLTPAWAVSDAGGIGGFPVLAGIDALTILVDHDANGAGQRQMARCLDRWLAAGREVLTLKPRQVGYDINDLLGAQKWTR